MKVRNAFYLAMLAGLSLFSCEKQPEGQIYVSGISSPWAAPGDTLRVSGGYFTKESKMLLGDTELDITHYDINQIKAVLPKDATSGKVLVKDGANEFEAGFLKILDNKWDQVFPVEAYIYHLYFLPSDRQTGWAFGREVTYKTVDGGNTWQFFDSPENQFEKVEATSTEHLIAQAALSLMQSTDGGQSWFTTSLPENFFIIDFAFVDARNGYVLGNRNNVYEVIRTADGGESWSSVISLHGYLNGRLFMDRAEEKLYLIDHYRQMFHVAVLPEADSWQSSDLPRLVPEEAPAYFGENGRGLIGGSTNDSWYMSVDQGPLWQNQPAVLWRTNNSGLNWESLSMTDLKGKPDVQVMDLKGENIIWVVGKDMILRSADGGKSWQERYIHWLASFNSHKLYIIDEENAFLLPYHGPLLRYQAALGE